LPHVESFELQIGDVSKNARPHVGGHGESQDLTTGLGDHECRIRCGVEGAQMLVHHIGDRADQLRPEGGIVAGVADDVQHCLEVVLLGWTRRNSTGNRHRAPPARSGPLPTLRLPRGGSGYLEPTWSITASATSRMVSRRSMDVFWIHRKASGSVSPILVISRPLARSTRLRVSNRSAISATSASRAEIS